MKRGTPSHRKTKRLARALGVPHYAAVGLLECLFHLAAGQAHDGNVGRFEPAEIAEELGWTGDPKALLDAFVTCGWVDRCRCHGLRVHDWPEHADQTVSRVLLRAKSGFLQCYSDASSVLARDEHAASTVLTPTEAEAGLPCLALPSLAFALPHASRDISAPPGAAPIPPPKRPPKRAPGVSMAPAALEVEQVVGLEAWCAEKFPGELPRLPVLVDACLDFHRGHGNRRADWPATCRTWVRNAAAGAFPRGPARPSPLAAAEVAANTTAAGAELLRAMRGRNGRSANH